MQINDSLKVLLKGRGDFFLLIGVKIQNVKSPFKSRQKQLFAVSPLIKKKRVESVFFVEVLQMVE